VTPARLLLNPAALRAVVATVLLPLSWPLLAHEGHDHDATAKPTDVRLAPRFEARSEELEVVGVLSDKRLLIYLDRADNNAPIQGAQIEVEGPGIKGVSTGLADGVYVLSAATLAHAGKYPLTLTVQAGEVADLLSVDLQVGEEPSVAPADSNADRKWWLIAGISLLTLFGVLITRRRRRQSE